MMEQGIMIRAGLPLGRIRVLEFTQALAGPLTGKVLADHGAQVIKIENAGHLRTHESRLPPVGAKDPDSLNLNPIANKLNTNKLSITLDLARPEAISVVKKLVSVSCVAIDNFAPHTLERFGLTYGELVKLKPDIIMARMPAMGQGSPYSHYRGWGWNFWALAGLNYASGFPETPPVSPCTVSYNDLSCNPFHTMFAILSALYYRARTGKGQLIELSQFESTLCSMGTAIFEYLVNGRPPKRMGNRSDYAAPHGVYRCQGDDRWCAIAVCSDAEWEALCRAMGWPELSSDERFASLLGRLRHAEELDRIVEEWTKGREAEEVMTELQAVGVAAGVVQNAADLFDRDPQLKERRHWTLVDHPEAGKVLTEGWGFELSAHPFQPEGRAPLLGEHNDYVLGEILGMSEEDINQCIMEGIVA